MRTSLSRRDPGGGTARPIETDSLAITPPKPSSYAKIRHVSHAHPEPPLATTRPPRGTSTMVRPKVSPPPASQPSTGPSSAGSPHPAKPKRALLSSTQLCSPCAAPDPHQYSPNPPRFAQQTPPAANRYCALRGNAKSYRSQRDTSP